MSARRREVSTCLLRDFLAASRAKPEEQATAVLAGALRSSETFRKALLAPLKLDDEGAVEIDTEVGTGVGGETVDLELRITTTDGRLRRRAWLEVKVNAKLAEARGNKKPQLIRYRHALDALDRKRPDLDPSVLAVLLRRADERRERPQIDATGAIVLHWHDVADIAEACGRALTGVDTSDKWRGLARGPGATLECANLETLLWFVDEASSRDQNRERREIVGVKASSPVTPQQAHGYAAAYQAVRAVYSLAERTEVELEDRGRITQMLEADSGVDDEDVFDLLTFRFKADPRDRRLPRSPWNFGDDGPGVIVTQ